MESGWRCHLSGHWEVKSPSIDASAVHPLRPKPSQGSDLLTRTLGDKTTEWYSVCEKNTPPDKKTCGNISLQNTKIGGWRAVSAAELQGKGSLKGFVFSQARGRIRVSYYIYIYIYTYVYIYIYIERERLC